jgi:hypothetical protein
MSERVERVSGYVIPPEVSTHGCPRDEAERAIVASLNERLRREHVSPEALPRVLAEEERVFFDWLAKRAAS